MRVCLIFCQYLMKPNKFPVGGELTFYNFWEQFGHSGWGEIPLSAGIWSQAVGGTSQVIWRLTSASRPVMWSSSRGQGDANCSPGQGNMSSQVDNDDTPLSSSRASVPSSSTKHSSNEAKQSSSGPGHPLSFVEIQSFEKI